MKMNKVKLLELLAFYQDQLAHTIVPFWLKHGIDETKGGYFTCFTNMGDRLVSTDKYTWSQGRMVWLFSKMAEMSGDFEYLRLAAVGYRFLLDHCFMENGNCIYLLDREGRPKEEIPGLGYDISIYVDCFVVMGFAKYAEVAGDSDALERALHTYDNMLSRVEQGSFRTEPEPIPAGYRSHGIMMFLLHAGQELCTALQSARHAQAGRIAAKCRCLADTILSTFVGRDSTVYEMVHESLESDDSLLGRCVCPGDGLESMWFVMHEMERWHDYRKILQIVPIVKRLIELGWDDEFGGIFYFVDKDGGQPRGSCGANPSPMEEKIRQNWDNKLWWVHAEGLYATLLAYSFSGECALLDCFTRLHDYTFSTFPNPNHDIGEWVQIRNRFGSPVEKVVALPVKDPFHIWRSLVMLIELLQKMLKSAGDQMRLGSS